MNFAQIIICYHRQYYLYFQKHLLSLNDAFLHIKCIPHLVNPNTNNYATYYEYMSILICSLNYLTYNLLQLLLLPLKNNKNWNNLFIVSVLISSINLLHN